MAADQDMSSPDPELGAASAELRAVLESAARLQELVPDAVLVGGSAAALYAGHRDSFDHDHVLIDLRDRFDVVLEALESEGDWVTNRVRPGKLILGRLGDIEAGVRQLIRARPLEAVEVALPSGRMLRAPTAAEALRVKAFLIVRRNQVRDYLDVAALSDRYGMARAAAVLSTSTTPISAATARPSRRRWRGSWPIRGRPTHPSPISSTRTETSPPNGTTGRASARRAASSRA